MFGNRTFQAALIISITVHAVVFLQNANLSTPSSIEKEKKLEISYIRKVQEEKTMANLFQKDVPLRLKARVTARNVPPPEIFDRDKIFNKRKKGVSPEAIFNKPVIAKPDIIAVKKIITLPAVDINKINSPSYINYYQVVREKIRRSAYQNYSSSEVGEVYISFIITNAGELKDTRLVKEKSFSSDYLRKIALASISDASPFPNFPEDLDYPQLTFNVVISFEIE